MNATDPTIHTVACLAHRLNQQMREVYDDFTEHAEVPDEPQRMLYLELLCQVQDVAGRLDEASRILAQVHGSLDKYLSPSFAERVTELRRQRAEHALKTRDFNNAALTKIEDRLAALERRLVAHDGELEMVRDDMGTCEHRLNRLEQGR